VLAIISDRPRDATGPSCVKGEGSRLRPPSDRPTRSQAPGRLLVLLKTYFVPIGLISEWRRGDDVWVTFPQPLEPRPELLVVDRHLPVERQGAAGQLADGRRQAREPARMVEWSAVSSNLPATAPMHPTLVRHVFHSEGRVYAD
jgi:hypothetical protein